MKASIPLAWNNAASTLTIGDRQGEYPGMLKNRKFNVVLVDPSRQVAFDKPAKGVTVDYSGNSVEVKL